MPGTNQGTAARVAAGTELISTLELEDVVDSRASAPKIQQIAESAFPAQLIKIGAGITVGSIGRLYPFDGNGATISAVLNGSTPSLKLDSTIPTTVDYTGCLVVPNDGTAIGVVRRIVKYTSATQWAELNRVYDGSTVPVAGNAYRVLVPTFLRSNLVVQGEYNSSAVKATLLPFFYDYPRTLVAVPLARKPNVFTNQADIMIENLQTSLEVMETGYYKGRAYITGARGALGAKILLKNLDGGTVSLWACGV